MAPDKYLNSQVMNDIDSNEFRTTDPFPWTNPQYFVSPDRYGDLLSSMPDISSFQRFFGKQRKHGQASHDRFVLEYVDGMPLAGPWQDFIGELRSKTYRSFICRLLNVRQVRFRFHWHYTPNGCEVSPHCDSKGKIGSQIFYLNTSDDWDPGWGGETVVLDDAGKFSPESAPAFEDFTKEIPAATTDNRSLLFGRRGNSWHGVRKINCPEDRYRKVFIVVFEDYRTGRVIKKRVRRLLTGQPLVTEKEKLMY